jgi:hypothetical protein
MYEGVCSGRHGVMEYVSCVFLRSDENNSGLNGLNLFGEEQFVSLLLNYSSTKLRKYNVINKQTDGKQNF